MIQKKYNYFKTLKEANKFAEEKQRKWHRATVKKWVYPNKVEYVVIWEAKKVPHGPKVQVKSHKREGYHVEGYDRSYPS